MKVKVTITRQELNAIIRNYIATAIPGSNVLGSLEFVGENTGIEWRDDGKLNRASTLNCVEAMVTCAAPSHST